MDKTESQSTAPLPSPAPEENLPMREHTVDRVRLSLKNTPEATGPAEFENATIADLLEHVSPQLAEEDEFQVYFLPAIKQKNEGEGEALLDDGALCQELTKKLHLEQFFLTPSAWDSNGFFSSRQLVRSESQDVYSYSTRFLIKFLSDTYGEPATDFSWLFLSFSVLWSRSHHSKKTSCVLVCYDDAAKIKTEIVEGLKSYALGNVKESPYAIYDALLRVIVWQFDNALWKFRKPIRSIEKTRRRVVERRMALNPTQVDGGLPDDHPEELAELSRHTLHMTETIGVAMRTANMALVRAETQSHSAEGVTKATMPLDNVVAGIQFSTTFLEGLKDRANAFAERVRNEIRTANNLVNLLQLKINEELLEESRDESKDLTKFVTNLTLFFLPVTFISGFWGMNLIELNEQKLIYFSPHIWIFFVSSLVSVILSYAAWYLVLKFSKRKGKK